MKTPAEIKKCLDKLKTEPLDWYFKPWTKARISAGSIMPPIQCTEIAELAPIYKDALEGYFLGCLNGNTQQRDMMSKAIIECQRLYTKLVLKEQMGVAEKRRQQRLKEEFTTQAEIDNSKSVGLDLPAEAVDRKDPKEIKTSPIFPVRVEGTGETIPPVIENWPMVERSTEQSSVSLPKTDLPASSTNVAASLSIGMVLAILVVVGGLYLFRSK